MTALRGYGLTQHSYESDQGVRAPATRPEHYHCPAGHVAVINFAATAEEIPGSWDCPKCGRQAHRDETAARRVGLDEPKAPLASPRTSPTGKTPWEMLLERRTVVELEEILAERLDLLRTSGR